MNVWKLAAAVCVATGCATAPPPEQGPGVYLALGDSVAFGFSPLVDLRVDRVSGYPEIIAQARGMEITNLACPGEASGGFVSPTGHDNHCRENRQQYPLHVAYEGTQLAAAVDYLAENHDVQLVTIDLGANDVFLLDDICNRDLPCILSNFVTTLTEYEKNLNFIFTQLRKNYDGPLVALSIYNPYPRDSTAQYAIEKIDQMLAEKIRSFGGLHADGMRAFAEAGDGDPCKVGLLIAMSDGTCDVHPTAAGAKVLADAITDVLP